MTKHSELLKSAIAIDKWLSTEIQSKAFGRIDESKRIELLRTLRRAITNLEQVNQEG